jgi:hypothetical protein
MKQYREAPPQIHVTYGAKGYQVVSTEKGGTGRRTNLGPPWPKPAEAASYAETLRTMPVVSPLRAE